MIQKIKNSLKKRKVKVFLVFLFCSASAWFISKLSEPYTSNTTFGLTYRNTSDDLLLVNSSQDKVDVKLKAVGFQFLGFNFKKKSVVIDLATVIKDGRQYYLPYQKYQGQIEKQLPASMELISMGKDTLFFDFQEVVSKVVPVKPRVQLNLAKNYLLDGNLEISPATIVVKGPKNEVDTISKVQSSRIELTDLTTNFSQKATITIPDGLRYTTFSASSVTVAGKVSRFSEKIMNVNIKAMNLPPDTEVKMFPDRVDILCKGTLNTLKNLKESDFEVIADFSKITNSKSKSIQLILNKRPDKLSNVTLQETESEYILKREE